MIGVGVHVELVEPDVDDFWAATVVGDAKEVVGASMELVDSVVFFVDEVDDVDDVDDVVAAPFVPDGDNVKDMYPYKLSPPHVSSG